MNEFESPLQIRPDTQLVADMYKEYTIKQKIDVERGLILFGVNLMTGEAKRVNIKSTLLLTFSKERLATHKAVYDPSLIYIWAINEKTAKRKALRDFTKFVERNKPLETINIDGIEYKVVKDTQEQQGCSGCLFENDKVKCLKSQFYNCGEHECHFEAI